MSVAPDILDDLERRQEQVARHVVEVRARLTEAHNLPAETGMTPLDIAFTALVATAAFLGGFAASLIATAGAMFLLGR